MANRFSNRNLISSINEYTKVMETGIELMRRTGETHVDAAVLTETIMMGEISMKCNHTASQNPNSLSYERPPENPSKIPTQLELINSNMTTNTLGNAKTRVNEVSSMIACGIASFVEFADRIENRNLDSGTILMTDTLSVTHAALMTFVFRNFVVSKGWDEYVSLIMLARSDTSEAMNAYIGRKENVDIIPCVDPITETYKIINAHSDTHLTVVTSSNTIINMCRTRFADSNLILNAVVDVDSLSKQEQIRHLISDIDGISEVVPCSNPNSRTIRITPAYRSGDISLDKPRLETGHTSLIAKMRWYENMIRHMSLNGVCIDCLIMFKIARPIALALSDREVILDEKRLTDPISDFSTNVSTVGMVDSTGT